MSCRMSTEPTDVPRPDRNGDRGRPDDEEKTPDPGSAPADSGPRPPGRGVESTWRSLLFAPLGDGQRRRRGSDAFRVGLAVLVIVLCWLATKVNSSSESVVARVMAPPPDGIRWLVTSIWWVGSVGLSIVVIVLALVSRRWSVIRDCLISGAGAWLVCVGLGLLLGSDGGRPPSGAPLGYTLAFPVARVAATVAVATAALPYLSRWLQLTIRVTIVLLALSTVVSQSGLPVSVLASLAVGVLATAVVHLVFGSPLGLLSAEEVSVLIGVLGVEVTDVRPASDQEWGVGRFSARSDGARISVDVYGRDASDAQLLAKLARFLLYRDSGPTLTVTRRQQVEHEAYLTLLAERAGVRVAGVLAAGPAGPARDALLITRPPAGRHLSEFPRYVLPDEPPAVPGEAVSGGAVSGGAVSGGVVPGGAVSDAEDAGTAGSGADGVAGHATGLASATGVVPSGGTGSGTPAGTTRTAPRAESTGHDAGPPVDRETTASTDGRPDVVPDGPVLSDAALDDIFRQVLRLRAAGIAHGSLAIGTIIVDDHDRSGFIDLRAASTVARLEQLDRDVAAALAATSVVVGPATAVASAARVLPEDVLVASLPFLQRAALNPVASRSMRGKKALLSGLREQGAEAAGVEAPKLIETRRISWIDLALLVGTLVGGWALIGVLVNVTKSWSTITGARWGWVAATFVLAQLAYPALALTTVGSVTDTMPYGRTVALEVSNTFVSLAGGSMGALATRVRFFQQQGYDATLAVSSGVLISTASWIVKGGLFLLALPIALSQFHFGTSPSDTGGGSGSSTANLVWLIVVAVIVVGVLVGLLLVVPRWRRLAAAKLRPKASEVWSHLKVLSTHPRNLVEIFGGDTLAQLFVAMALGTSLHAFDQHLGLASLLIVLTLGSMLGGVSPVPGGMGVVEAGMILGLTAAGIPESDAVAAVFVQRLFTAYLPPIWGWFCLVWMRRKEYL